MRRVGVDRCSNTLKTHKKSKLWPRCWNQYSHPTLLIPVNAVCYICRLAFRLWVFSSRLYASVKCAVMLPAVVLWVGFIKRIIVDGLWEPNWKGQGALDVDAPKGELSWCEDTCMRRWWKQLLFFFSIFIESVHSWSEGADDVGCPTRLNHSVKLIISSVRAQKSKAPSNRYLVNRTREGKGWCGPNLLQSGFRKRMRMTRRLIRLKVRYL